MLELGKSKEKKNRKKRKKSLVAATLGTQTAPSNSLFAWTVASFRIFLILINPSEPSKTKLSQGIFTGV